MLLKRLLARPQDPPEITVEFDGEAYCVRLQRHRLARRYTLRVQSIAREIVLTMPPRGSVKEARAFAQKHGA